MVTAFGVVALTFMMTMYALEHVHRRFTLAFAFGCLLSSGYGFLSGAWPFGIVEVIWAVIAVRRFRVGGSPHTTPTDTAGSAGPAAPSAPEPDGFARPRREPPASTPAAEVEGDAPLGGRLTTSANPSTVGEPVTFVARLEHPASGAPGGAIAFGVGLFVLATVPVDGDGTARLTTSMLSTGRHLVIASVDGDARGSARTALLEQVVTDRPG